jgi:hypothetical protein
MEKLGSWIASCEAVSYWGFGIGLAFTLLLIFMPGLPEAHGLALDLRYWKQWIEFTSRRKLVFASLCGAVSFFITAGLADPYVTLKPIVSIYGKPVVAVVDISGSMSAKPDAYVNGVRNQDLRTSYEKACDIFNDLIGRRPDVNFALLLYSTESYIARYFAYKNELFKDSIEDRKEIEYISMGTQTAAALNRARRFLTDNVQGKDKAIVLISDLNIDLPAMVETTEEVERDLDAGIKVHVIAITSAGKKPGPLGRVGGLHIVDMDDKAGIDQIVQEISEIPSSPLRQELVVRKQSLIPYLILPGLALIVISLVLTETRFRKIP